MRKGNRFLSDRSIVMQNQTTRCGNGTMTVFVLIGLIGFPGLGSASPIIVEPDDPGGGAGVLLTAHQRVAARLFDEVVTRRTADVRVLPRARDSPLRAGHDCRIIDRVR